MNLTDLDIDLSKEFKISKRQARKQLNFINKTIRKKLLFGEEISIYKVGCFKLQIRKSRLYLCMQTNKMKTSKKKFYLSFSVTKSMRESLKNKTVWDEETL